MKKDTPLNYVRRGWKDTVLHVASHDEKAGTVDLANAEGVVLVTSCRLIKDPSKETSLPAGYATPLDAPAADKRGRTVKDEEEAAKKAAEEEAAKKAAEEEAAKKAVDPAKP